MIDPRENRRGEGMALVCLGWVPWGRSWKRNQSMFYQLSQRELFERAVFVNPKAMWLSDRLLTDEGEFAARFAHVRESLPRAWGDKIRICSQWHFLPFGGRIPGGRRLEDWLFHRMIGRFTRGRPFVLLNNHPNFFSPKILDDLMGRARLRVFDLSDDFVEFFTDEHHRAHFRRNIEACCRKSDLVLTVNDHVATKYGGHNPHTHVVPNSTNFDNFSRDAYRPVPWLEGMRSRSRKILGCTGTINRVRIDYELLERLVTEFPDYAFAFVGSADPSFHDLVRRHENLHHHESVLYEELPDWIHGFDAAIIPFRVNEHTRGNDLLKFHDYLAMGASVVSTDTGGARKFADLIHVAAGHEDFIRAVDEALRPVDPDLRERRIDMARRNSWNQRVLAVEQLIRERLEATSR